MNAILTILKLIGSLALFLYGMKLMSESLQKIAGNRMRQILASMTGNRFTGVLTGIVITALVQSSSATTVMVVSFANAGLIDLIGSINVILGANIGTTVTSWIVALLGFNGGAFSLTTMAVPIIAFSLPLLFSKSRSRKSWGEMIIGFGILFVSIAFLQECLPPDLAEKPGVSEFVASISSHGFWSIIIFVLIGAIATAIFQSSAAIIALTLVICASGLIGFTEAAAMIMGENIGTTITANLAAAVANAQAKRAALSHLLINVFGVIWMLAVFPYFLQMISNMCVNLHIAEYSPMYSNQALLQQTFTEPEQQTVVRASVNAAMPLALSLYNTVFKVINVLILVWLVRPMAKLITRMIPAKKQEAGFSLKHIKIGLLSTPEASLYQAQEEILHYGQDTLNMFKRMEAAFELPADQFEKEMEQLRTMEDESDHVEVEIANYLTKVSESRMATETTQRLRAMFKIVSEIESIADTTLHIAGTVLRRNENKQTFPVGMTEKIKKMFAMAEESIQVMCVNLAGDYSEVVAKKAYEVENEINLFRTVLKQEHMVALEEKRYDYNVGILYNDIISECEKAGDYAINVTQAMQEVGRQE